MNGSSLTAGLSTPASAEPRVHALAVACSGGPDSMALLWIVWHCASAMGIRTQALHVQHGLLPAAQAWPEFIAQECARWSSLYPHWPAIEVRVRHLKGRPPRGQSVEAWAREGRYEALQSMAQDASIDLLLLAHHRQDQAETFVLQALRGAGPQGLAGMPGLAWRQGVCWARPFLNHSPQAVRQVVAQSKLRFVQDPSNVDTQLARNALRQSVWPALTAAFPSAQTTLARAAFRCAQALETLQQGVQADRARCVVAEKEEGRRWVLDVSCWQGLSRARRSQVLRTWFAQHGVRAPSALVDRLASHEFVSGHMQRWPLDDQSELRWYRGELSLGRTAQEGCNPPPCALRWTRSGSKRPVGWGGTLTLRRADAGDPGAALALPRTLLLRARLGEDQFQLAPGATARSLKKQFQARSVPAWDRVGPVVTDEEGTIFWVPGLGWDARVLQVLGGWRLDWTPDDAAPEEDLGDNVPP